MRIAAEVFLVLIVLWAWWQEWTAPRVHTKLSLLRMGLGFFALVVLARGTDLVSTVGIALVVLVFLIILGIKHEQQKRSNNKTTD